MDAPLLRCHRPVQPACSWVKRGMDRLSPKRHKPVQTALSLASGGMDAANQSRRGVDREGMEARDGFGLSEGHAF